MAFRNNLELRAASQGRVTSFLASGISKNPGWWWREKKGVQMGIVCVSVMLGEK